MMYERMTLKRLFYFLLLSLLLVRCGGDPSGIGAHSTFLQHVVQSDSGIFRGLEMGMGMDPVMAKEMQQPAEVDDYYLYYEMIVETDTADSYALAYTFDSTGLMNIQADIYPGTPEKAAALMEDLKSYFTKRYGEGANDKGFITWQGERKGRKIALSIADETESALSPLLSLNIYYAD